MAVGLVRFEEPTGAIARAVELCNGLDGLISDSRVLIKPNLVLGSRGRSKPSPGIVTTDTMVEELIRLLRDAGCKDITIGEGSVALPNMALDTKLAFVSSGVADVAQRHGVELVDFNAGPFETVEAPGGTVRVAQRALEADFFINMPVLKTHVHTKISLGLKNLKGCLDTPSKKKFHDKLGLERSIAWLATKVPVHLTIIDGTYGLQRGPMGRDFRTMNLIVAGRDRLEVEIVGCRLMGIEPNAVVHLSTYAEMVGRTLGEVDVRGVRIEDVAEAFEWRWDWPAEMLSAHGVEGMRIDTPGDSNCSGCTTEIFVALSRFLKENQGAVFDSVEVCIGKEPIAKATSKHVFLLGKCPMFANRGVTGAIKVKGCPPTMQDTYEALKKFAAKVGR